MSTHILDEHSLVVGCNYHTTWQNHSAMRFVLKEVRESKARLYTRVTKKEFWTDVKDLIFILSPTNVRKAREIMRKEKVVS